MNYYKFKKKSLIQNKNFLFRLYISPSFPLLKQNQFYQIHLKQPGIKVISAIQVINPELLFYNINTFVINIF